jgi:formate-dependent nitrite reductase cytochrome c552 subunit
MKTRAGLAALALAAAGFAATLVYAINAGPQNTAPAPIDATAPPPTNWPVVIRTLDKTPAVPTSRTTFNGEPVSVSCMTCHATTTPNRAARSADDLKHFHQGLRYQHGNLSCISCHNPEDYDTLRLADGTSVDFKQVMNLCAQCHGTQARDYQNGAHGGMTGYWDLTKGPRYRNNCIDCHNPHAPKYQPVIPVFPPKDRTISSPRGAKH